MREHGYLRDKAYVAAAVEDAAEPDETGSYDALFTQRNKMKAGDTVELLTPGQTGRAFTADTIRNEEGEEIDCTPHPSMRFRLRVPFPVREGDILRMG